MQLVPLKKILLVKLFAFIFQDVDSLVTDASIIRGFLGAIPTIAVGFRFGKMEPCPDGAFPNSGMYISTNSWN